MTVYVKLILTAFFWGGTFVAARVIAQDVGPFNAAFFRFVIASFFLIGLTKQFEGSIPPLRKHQIIPAVLLGLTGVFGYNFFFFCGLKTVAASRGSLIVATNPVLIAILAAFFFKEKLNFLRCVGILLCICGAVVVISRGDIPAIFDGTIGAGELYIFGCVASWVAYSLVGKVIMKDMAPMAAVMYSCILGTLFLSVPAWAEGMVQNIMNCTVADWIGVFYLGFFGSALGFSWYYQGINAIGASRASIFINFVPISAVILAFLVLRERIDLSLIVGAAMVVSGAYLTNKKA